MVGIKFKFDRLTSVLMSYHILCAPTDRNRKFNPNIFSGFEKSITQQERKNYLSYLSSKGVSLNKTDSFRKSLFSPKSLDLKDYYLSPKGENLPCQVQINLQAFESRFSSYLDGVEEKVKPLIEDRGRMFKELINKIYDLAQEFTGVVIKRPEELEVRIVEGLAPSSMGDMIDGKEYILLQSGNLLEPTGSSCLLSIIHEAVAHQTAYSSITAYTDIFREYYIYDIDEGFAKVFSKKIAERISGGFVNYKAWGGLEELAYNTFDRNWASLNKSNFNSWYKDCLIEIKKAQRK